MSSSDCLFVLFRAAASFLSVNGSTAGIIAAVLATCPPDVHLIASRNSHVSATHAMVLAGWSVVVAGPLLFGLYRNLGSILLELRISKEEWMAVARLHNGTLCGQA